MKSVLVVMGTRPEAIKLAPVVAHLRDAEGIRVRILSTGQHREMLAQTLETFKQQPDIDLNVMTPNQTLPQLTSRLIAELDVALAGETPALVVVQGDTTTAMTAALAAYYRQIPVAHVEAGLRTDDKYSPFPEEMNRRLITSIATLHFAPTESARANLRRDGVADEAIVVTGNTAIDALLMTVRETAGAPFSVPTLSGEALTSDIIAHKRVILVTAHRRESHDEGLASICEALREISDLPDSLVVFPVHLNPNVRSVVLPLLAGVPNLYATEPLAYDVFCALMKKSFLILTDSGGIQEEAPSLGVPVLVMRALTERQEGIDSGNAILTGTSAQSITAAVRELWRDSARYAKMSSASNPYGDGHAAEKISSAISGFLEGRSSFSHATTDSSSTGS